MPIFNTLKDRMIASFAPVGEEELQLAHSIAWDSWRLNKARGMESTMFAMGTQDPTCDPDNSLNDKTHEEESNAYAFKKEAAKFGNSSLYVQRISRMLERERKELHQIQSERKAKYEQELADEILIARYCKEDGCEYEPLNRKNANGLVFSKDEIIVLANRATILEVMKHRQKPTGGNPKPPKSGPGTEEKVMKAA